MSTKLYDISEWCKRGHELIEYPYIGEVDVELNIFEVIKIENEYYVPGVLNKDRKTAGVRKVQIALEPEDRDYESNMACPYCGYEDDVSWELGDSDEEHECGRCGAVMSFERVVTVEYSSSPVKPPIIKDASWV